MPRKIDNQMVKDALQAKDIDILKSALVDLTILVKDGFAGVHARQDQTNGKVLKAGEDIIANRNATDIKFTEVKSDFKYNRVIWYFLTVSVTIITALVSFIIFKK